MGWRDLGMNQASILVVIVNYRTPDMVLQCLASIQAERIAFPNIRVHVIDNASGDGSAKVMQEGAHKKGWDDWVRIMASAQNPGFGAGNNVILREELACEYPADFFFILNPDTVVCPGIFHSLLGFFDANPHASILGPRTESEIGIPDHSAFRFPGMANALCDGVRFAPLDRLLKRWRTAPEPRSEAHQTDWVSGGGMFIRRKVLQEIGLFDENFFLYFEETDLCHRAANHGFQTWYVPEAGMMHWAGASTGVASDGRPRKRMPGWWFASRRHYLRNFHNSLYVGLCDWLFTIGRSAWQLRAWLTRRKPTDPPHFLWDFARFNLLGQRWDKKS